MRISSLILLTLFALPVEAAKILVTWTNPTTNTDGSTLTNLAFIHIEWGTCVNGNQFGQTQAFVTVAQRPNATTQTYIYPSGLARVCVRGFAINTESTRSSPSNVSVKELLPSPGKPVTLGQPVIIDF
jgi:hypothetical protein